MPLVILFASSRPESYFGAADKLSLKDKLELTYRRNHNTPTRLLYLLFFGSMHNAQGRQTVIRVIFLSQYCKPWTRPTSRVIFLVEKEIGVVIPQAYVGSKLTTTGKITWKMKNLKKIYSNVRNRVISFLNETFFKRRKYSSIEESYIISMLYIHYHRIGC